MSSLTIATMLMFTALPELIAPQHPIPASRDGRQAGLIGAPAPNLSRAIDLAADYLERACGMNGRFAYRVDTTSGRQSSSYNIVRHAGAMYVLGMFNNSHPDPQAVNAMIRAAGFLRVNYIGPDARSNTLVVWSRPLPMKSDAGLGASGLGLAALASVQQARPNTVPLEQLQALGRFILYLQKDDGSFTSKYLPDSGPSSDWQSLYYPGEAALGLIALDEIDHSNEWLTAAGRALSYLARSREGAREVPPDHWALIATAKFLPHINEIPTRDRVSCCASRAELVAHAIRISRSFLQDQIANSPDARLNGGFDPRGGTTQTATRLEGLLATLEFLPAEDAALRAQIEAAAKSGIEFLLRAQIATGPYAGGMPQTVLGDGSDPKNAELRGSDVRIDYVQHALSAWLRYQHLHLDGEGGRQ
jgi:hypothetical protein